MGSSISCLSVQAEGDSYFLEPLDSTHLFGSHLTSRNKNDQVLREKMTRLPKIDHDSDFMFGFYDGQRKHEPFLTAGSGFGS